MMRKSLLTLVLVALIGFVSAQNLSLMYNGEVCTEGQTIVCNEFDEIMYDFHLDLQIKNNTDNGINVVFGKEVVSIPDPNVFITFCCGGDSGNCYAGDLSEPFEISAQSLEDVSVHYMNNDIPGTAVVKFFAYEERNPDEKVSVTVHFNSAETVSENASNYSISHAFPNPASSEVRFNVNCNGNANASIALYNLLGQEVMSQHADNGLVIISVADLNEGIYFCNFKVNGQVVTTEKFIVKK